MIVYGNFFAARWYADEVIATQRRRHEKPGLVSQKKLTLACNQQVQVGIL